jgi:serine/threonine protein kinase
LTKIVEEVGIDIKELSNEFASMVLKINAMNNTMEKLLEEQTKHAKNDNDKVINDKLNEVIQSKIDKIFVVRQLKISDYEQTDKERKEGRVTKWVNIKNKGEEFAFKIVSEEEKLNVQNQVTILRELHDWQNIIKIYGLTCEGNKWFLVSEWAEYGNLREYYTTFKEDKERFNLRIKLRMSLDIARGLNFLRAVEVKKIFFFYFILFLFLFFFFLKKRMIFF